ESSFPRKNIETHALVEELDDPNLREKRRTLTVGLLTQHHDTRITDCSTNRFQIFEIICSLRGVYRTKGRRIRLQPHDSCCAFASALTESRAGGQAEDEEQSCEARYESMLMHVVSDSRVRPVARRFFQSPKHSQRSTRTSSTTSLPATSTVSSCSRLNPHFS